MHNIYEYDILCKTIESCVIKTTYEKISDCECLIIVALNEEIRLKKCVDNLLKNKPGINIVFISQPAMEMVLKEWYGEYPVIGWKGKYTLDIIPDLEKNVDLSLVKGFLYFTEQPINTRDMNFIQIAEKLQDTGNIRLFSNTIGEDLYEYHDLARYIQAVGDYERINQELDCL